MKRANVSIVAAASLVATLLVSSPASAVDPDPITFRVEGVVNSVDNVPGVSVGQAYTLDYTFDASTAADFANAVTKRYPAVTSMSLMIDGISFATSSGGTISIANDVVGSPSNSDEYRADFASLHEAANTDAPSNEIFFQMTAVASGGPSDAITGLALPVSPPDPAEYDYYTPYLAIGFGDDDCDPPSDPCVGGVAQASVNTITLIPSSVITFRVDGVVNYLDGVAVQLGQPYTIEYTFEAATAARFASEYWMGYSAVTSMSLTIDGILVASTSAGVISVADNALGSPSNHDTYGAGFDSFTEFSALGPTPLTAVTLGDVDSRVWWSVRCHHQFRTASHPAGSG